MPELLDTPPNTEPKSLIRKERRSRLTLRAEMATYAYKTLGWCDKARAKLVKHLQLEQDPLVLCKVVSALDTISERQRIMLGIPLPGARKPIDKPTIEVKSNAEPVDAVIVPEPSGEAPK